MYQLNKTWVPLSLFVTIQLPPAWNRLYQDLVGDGWKVKRIDVNRSSNPADAAGVRNKIIELYHLNPDTKQVFIIGHVAVPYSGGINPDGHSIHYGAWPADGYYGDMVNDNWTDTTDFSYYPTTRAQNINLKGDGKFDQNKFQSVQLAVGRVDFANMPAFSLSEISLLARYLNKDHLFRQGASTISKRGLIEDNFSSYDEKFPQIAWKSYGANIGFDNITVGQFETGLSTPGGYMWSYGTGAGTYNNCSGIASTTSFAANSYNTVFTQLFGSYFGDWDSQDNLLRAAIASQGSTLASVWSGRPFWYFHHMAAGYTIGYAALLTMNNKGTYSNTGYGYNMTHIALMGDPSLKSNYIKPVSNISAQVNKTVIELNWNVPTQTNIHGYNVYRSNSITNNFVLLNTTHL
jgi:hypothetical protein